MAVIVGDCRAVMAGMDEASVDAIVCDPPYGLEFMGKEWDRLGAAPVDKRLINDPAAVMGNQDSPNGGNAFSRSRVRNGQGPGTGAAMQAWHEAWLVEAFRVLKPGGMIAAFGGTRTVHRLACAMEDAGFEIRDQCVWLHGQGFPKNLDVSKALRAAPTCRCGVAEVGGETVSVDSALPLGTGGAGVGTVPGTVPLAGFAADETSGVGPKSGAGSLRRQGQVNGGVKELAGQLDPVVLRSPDVAVVADGDEVGFDVRGVQADPEPLRDAVMGDEVVGGAAVGTRPVAGDDALGDGTPTAPLVLPLASAPRGILGAGDTDAVVGGHAVPGAVDGAVRPAPELRAADLAGEYPIASASPHEAKYTTERQVLARCERCGLLIADTIPDGLGTALKPGHEPIVLARKPLVGTVAATVAAYGTGALNIDATRIGVDERGGRPARDARAVRNESAGVYGDDLNGSKAIGTTTQGRWPANVLLDAWDEPVARLRYNTPDDAARVIREYFDGYGRLPALRQEHRDAAQPGRPDEVLLTRLLRGVDEREPAGRAGAALRAAAHPGDGGEDRGDQGGEPADGRAVAGVEGRAPHLARLRDDRGGDLDAGRTDSLRADDDPEQRAGDPGTPARDGAAVGAPPPALGDRPPQERGQVGQPAGEPGDQGQRRPQEGALAGAVRTPAPTRGERTADVPALLVLECDIPAGWRQYFELTGATVPSPDSSAAALDAQSGERKGSPVAWSGNGVRNGSSLNAADDGSLSTAMEFRGYGDTGGASRFFYVAKASRAERNAGLDGMPERDVDRYGEQGQGPSPQQTPRVTRSETNHHPTVKPVALMRHLVRLVTPPGGLCLDPFAGSGTTGVACAIEGVRFVGIEQDPDYAEIAERRIAHAERHGDAKPNATKAPAPKPATTPDLNALPLFAAVAD